MQLNKDSCIGVIGAGTMGSSIAQLAASFGHKVILFDSDNSVIKAAAEKLQTSLELLIQKNKITKTRANDINLNIHFASSFTEFAKCNLIIEAVIEDLAVKQDLLKKLEQIVSPECMLATNTSSLSITSIASPCMNSSRVLGIHFFNPATLMPLVEVIPGLATNPLLVKEASELINTWDKTTVIVKDTPGFIVNRVARPFYGEAIKIYEEGIADFITIDWAMKEIGGFRMGPFELMDFIGNDVNFKVTETVWTQLFYDNRYKPSLTQKRLFEAGYWGKKRGRGYYDYSKNAQTLEPKKDNALGQKIFLRIISMLINEAYDALYLNIASREDLEIAMTKGVNYPKGLLKWSEDIGPQKILNTLMELHSIYLEDRYRPSVMLRNTCH